MFDFLLLCLATAGISTALPLHQLQTILQSTPQASPSQSNASDTLSQQIRESQSPRTFVGVSFKSSSSLDIPSQYFEFPLGERISPLEFPMLPFHPAHARIVNASVQTGSKKKLLSVGRLPDFICMAYPKVEGGGDEERATGLPLYRTAEVYPMWWLTKDGEVDFEDPSSRWYLAGQDIESYECI